MSDEQPRDGESTADMRRGLIYAHNRANANTAEVHQTAATVHALVDLLLECGVVDRDALETRRQQPAEALRRQYIDRGMAVALQEFGVSKYEFQGGAVIDCESRIGLCKAACCRLPLALSREDVEEGALRWELGRPYLLARGADGYCAHLDRTTRRCGIYSRRPIPCRGYDCRNDRRIWLDFVDRVPNPRIGEPGWPECATADEPPAANGAV